MSGHEHYAKAEKQLATITDRALQRPDELVPVEVVLAAAQVHATLALAAAVSELNRAGAWTVAR